LKRPVRRDHPRARLTTLAVLAVLAGCQSIPKDAFKLPPTSLEDRQLQSRKFDTVDHRMLLASGASVLQDLGYALDASNADLGVLTASKDLDATNAGQVAGAVFLAALTGTVTAVDKEQNVRVCLVINRSLEDRNASIARISVQRVIWNTQGQMTRAETVKDSELYQSFFEKLAKSAFLEAHQL